MARSDADNLKVFAGRRCKALTERVCGHLDMPMGMARTEVFPDGEMLVILDEDVRGRDCFVILSTCDPVNENLVELLIFADSLRRASAQRVTAVIPYFGYGRQDRKDRGRTPITAKLVANLITTAGYDRVLALDLHAAQIQGFFDIPVDHLSAAPVFYAYLRKIREELGDLVMVSPDVGNVKVANTYADVLGGDLAIVDKRRLSGSEVVSTNLVGSVKGKMVIMFDDMIATGGTICEAARVVMEHGARGCLAAATHPVLAKDAPAKIAASPIQKLIVANTIPGGDRYAPLQDRIVELCIGKLLADAIHHIHHNLSVSALFKEFGGSKR